MRAKPEVPDLTLGTVLGTGGFGTVYAAIAVDSGRALAVKVAHSASPTAREELAAEAAAMKAVGPPTVPALVNQGVLADGRAYLGMERLEGESLTSLLLGEPLPVARFAQVARALLEAVIRVHDSGFVHCDLKPENCFLSPDGSLVRLIDFGLAVPSPGNLGGQRPSAKDPELAGTPEYMAPEQCDPGVGALDPRTDLYALGVIFYELLTGHVPFFGAPGAVRHEHTAHRPPPLSSAVPAALAELVLGCLAKAPARRPLSARDLSTSLNETLEAALAAARAREADPSAAGEPSRAPAPQTRAEGNIEQQVMALLCFITQQAPAQVSKAVGHFDGVVASMEDRRFAVAFSADFDGPQARALACARALAQQGTFERAVLQGKRITLRKDRRGRAKIVGQGLSELSLYPDERDPPGLTLHAELLSAVERGCAVSPSPRPGFVTVPLAANGDVDTVVTTATFFGGGGTSTVEADPFIGHAQLRQRLIGAARSALEDGRPRVDLILGARGYGKSRLAGQLVASLQAEVPPLRVVSVRAQRTMGDAQGFGIGPVLRLVLELAPDEKPECVRQRLQEVLGTEASLVLVAAAQLGADDLGHPQLQAMAAAPGALESAASRVLGEALLWRARKGPVAVLLDDAHFANLALSRALSYARATGAAVPLWVGLFGTPGLETILAGAFDGPPVELPVLAEADAHALCRQLLRPAESVPQDLIAELSDKADRVPLYLTELVRGLKSQQVLQQQGRRWVVASDRLDEMKNTPVTHWLAESATRQLSDVLRRHAGLAALLGFEFEREELEAVLARLARAGAGEPFPLDAQVSLGLLCQHGICVPSAGNRYRFRTDIARDAVMAALRPELRSAVHKAAVDYYQGPASSAQGRVERLTKLAHHAAAAGLGALALESYLACAQAHTEQHAYLAAERAFTGALGLQTTVDAPQELLRALRGRGRMRYRLGRYEAALEDLERARGLAEQAGDPEVLVGVLLELATALDWNHQHGPAVQRVADAAALRDRVHAPDQLLALDLGLARSMFREGQWDGAAARLSGVAVAAAALGDAGYELQIAALNLLSAILPALGELARAEQLSNDAMALCRARHDRLHLAGLTQNRVMLGVARQDAAWAAEETRTARRLFRELGMLVGEYHAEANLGELEYQQGHYPRALEHTQQGKVLQELLYSRAGRPVLELLQARIHGMAGDWAQARAAVCAVAQLQAAGGDEARLLVPEAMLANALELALRGATDEEWDGLLQQSEQLACESEHVEVAEFRALQARRAGDLGTAQRFYRLAQARCGGTTLLRDRLARALSELDQAVST